MTMEVFVFHYCCYRYETEDPCSMETSPLVWWRGNYERYPLLATYFRANSSFQATSVASERVFSIDNLVMKKQRKNMNPERHANLVFSQDFLKKRVNNETFRLCKKCGQPPNEGASYKLTCQKHNGPPMK